MSRLPLVVIFAVLLVLVSCTPEYREQEWEDWQKGDDGITIGMSHIPSKVYSGEMLNLVIDVNNEGAYDNPPGKVVLSGFDKNYIHFSTNYQVIPAIAGKSAYDSIGGQDRVTFEETSGVNVPFGGIYKTTLSASACYYYETYATPNICIIPDPSDPIAREICTPRPVRMKDQGAPVAVTEVQTETMQNYVNVIVTIENVGGGDVLANTPEAYQHCPNNNEMEYDYVEFELYSKNLASPQCSVERVKLMDGEGRFSCKFVTLDMEPTETQIGIKLKYNYKVNTKKELTIQAPSSFEGGQIPGETPDPYSITPSPDDTPDRSSSGFGEDDACDCTQEEIDEWGGCVCIIVNDKKYHCRDGSVDRLPVDHGDVFDVRATGFKACGYSYTMPYENSAKWKKNPCTEEEDGKADINQPLRFINIFAYNDENPKKDRIHRECLFAFG